MAATETTDGEPFAELRAFERDILVHLKDEGPTYGLELKERLEAFYDSQVHHGRLYPNLTELEEKGYLSISQLDKRTNEYSLTDKAEAEMQAHQSWLNGCLDD